MNKKKIYECPETHTDTYIVPRKDYPDWMKSVPTKEQIFLACNRCEDFFIITPDVGQTVLLFKGE